MMRVVQLIDSLDPGGAERVAVNLANAMRHKVGFSGLVTTRKEGELKDAVANELPYLFLDKRKVIDIEALRKFTRFLKTNRVNLVHAHSSSLVFAVMAKLVVPGIKIVWHDHYGNSEFLAERKSIHIRLAKRFVSLVISVNDNLRIWAAENIGFKKVCFVPNFALLNAYENKETKLQGEEGKRIVCLANYRPQKDHINLLNAYETVVKEYPDWTLHLVGKDFNDDYSRQLKAMATEPELMDKVFIYGSRKDTAFILSQSEIGVLASRSEGLPLALLEYGLSKLPVVVTNVGQCAQVVENNVSGYVVPLEDASALSEMLRKLISDKEKRQKFGNHLYTNVVNNYGAEPYLATLIKLYEEA